MQDFSKVARLAAVSLMSVTLAACTTNGGYFKPQTSVVATQLDAVAADAVAADMVTKMSEYVGPGTGTLSIKADNTAFASAFDKHLREWGYAVELAAPTPNAGTAAPADANTTTANLIPVAYTVDTADGAVIARISTPSVELTRTYQVTTTGAIPSSPLSVMKRGASN